MGRGYKGRILVEWEGKLRRDESKALCGVVEEEQNGGRCCGSGSRCGCATHRPCNGRCGSAAAAGGGGSSPWCRSSW